MSWPGGGGADCCKRTQEAREVRLAQMWGGWGSSSKFRYLNPVTCVAHILSQRIKRFFSGDPWNCEGQFFQPSTTNGFVCSEECEHCFNQQCGIQK